MVQVSSHSHFGLSLVSPTLKGYPWLAGQDAIYLAGGLGAYRSGARRSDAMMAMAMRLSDQDIANLAAYFPPVPSNDESHPDENHEDSPSHDFGWTAGSAAGV